MSEYIDFEIAREYLHKACECLGSNGGMMLKIRFDEEPIADVVEVVRCKDCKFRKIEFGWNGKKYKMCANTDYPTDDDAYCSYGERREDEQIY